MDEVTAVPVVSTILYVAAAVAMVTAGAVALRRWATSRPGRPAWAEELSPVGDRALGYAAALAAGALVVVAAGRRETAWEDLAFGCFAVGLGLCCVQFLLGWSSPRVTTAVLIGGVGMGAVIAAGG